MEKLRDTFNRIELRLEAVENSIQQFRHINNLTQKENFEDLIGYAKYVRKENSRLRKKLKNQERQPQWVKGDYRENRPPREKNIN